jgi:hypothetical protein
MHVWGRWPHFLRRLDDVLAQIERKRAFLERMDSGDLDICFDLQRNAAEHSLVTQLHTSVSTGVTPTDRGALKPT